MEWRAGPRRRTQSRDRTVTGPIRSASPAPGPRRRPRPPSATGGARLSFKFLSSASLGVPRFVTESQIMIFLVAGPGPGAGPGPRDGRTAALCPGGMAGPGSSSHLFIIKSGA
eukprot:263972-Hanusia_phi.AAC.1